MLDQDAIAYIRKTAYGHIEPADVDAHAAHVRFCEFAIRNVACLEFVVNDQLVAIGRADASNLTISIREWVDGETEAEIGAYAVILFGLPDTTHARKVFSKTPQQLTVLADGKTMMTLISSAMLATGGNLFAVAGRWLEYYSYLKSRRDSKSVF